MRRGKATSPAALLPPPPTTRPLARRCRDGRRSGHAEGRALGLGKGFEVGHEVGFYSGCCQLWRQLQARDPQLFRCAATTAGAAGVCWAAEGLGDVPPPVRVPGQCVRSLLATLHPDTRKRTLMPHLPHLPGSQRVDKGIASLEAMVRGFPLSNPQARLREWASICGDGWAA